MLLADLRSPLLPVLLGVALLPRAAAADDLVDPFTEPDESELFRAEQELITVASRYAQTTRQAPGIVTVVSARDIRETGARTLADVLRGLPGIYISVAVESRELAWFRGVTSSDNNKILVLVDGVPWYDGIYTHSWIDEYIPLEHVKQIEVIKGPGSALYGTNAFSGVINVVTWDGASLDGGYARGTVGSDGRAGAAGVFADRVAIGRQELEVRAYVRALGIDGEGMDVTPRDRRDVNGLDPRRSLNGGLAVRVDGLSASVDVVDYRHTYFVNEQDDALDVLLNADDDFHLAYRNVFANLRYDIDLGPLGRLSPYAYTQRHDNPGSYAFFGAGDVVGDQAEWDTTLVETEKDSVRHGVGLESWLVPAAGHATVTGAGVEAIHLLHLEDLYFEDLAHEPTTPSTFRADPTWITDSFLFAQHTWTATWWLELTGGARVDYHSYFGPFVSPRAGALFVPGDKVLIKLLYGRAFRAPTARELLVEVGQDDLGSNLFTSGNPGLQPELIDTLETELTMTPLPAFEARVAGFASGIEQQIAKVSGSDAVLGDIYYDNLAGGVLAVGAEAQLTWDDGPLLVDASYSWTRATDRESGNAVYEFPPHMAHGRVSYDLAPPVTFSVLGDIYGKRPRQGWTPESRRPDGDAFGLLHLALTTDAIADGRVVADLSVRNLLDSSYETLVPQEDADAVNDDGTARYPRDIEGEGRTVQASVEVRF